MALISLKGRISGDAYTSLDNILKKYKISQNEPLSFQRVGAFDVNVISKYNTITFDISKIEMGVLGLNKSQIILDSKMTIDDLFNLINSVTNRKEVSFNNYIFDKLINQAHADNFDYIISGLAIVALAAIVAPLVIEFGPIVGTLALVFGFGLLASDSYGKQPQNEIKKKICDSNSLRIDKAFVIIDDNSVNVTLGGKLYLVKFEKNADGFLTSINFDGKIIKIPSDKKLKLNTTSLKDICPNDYLLDLKNGKIERLNNNKVESVGDQPVR